MDEEYSYRQKYYRSVYYGNPNAPSSMHSGWSSEDSQLKTYQYYLDFINRDGTVIDLGCGNGRLLRFLCDSGKAKLVPYGVDFLEESIKEAKQIVLPEYASNFYVGNIYTFDPSSQKFSYVITNLIYICLEHQQQFLKRCYEWTESGGKLLIYDYIGSKDFDKFPDPLLNWERKTSKLILSANIGLACYEKA